MTRCVGACGGSIWLLENPTGTFSNEMLNKNSLAQMALFTKNYPIIYGRSFSVNHPVISWNTKANKRGSASKAGQGGALSCISSWRAIYGLCSYFTCVFILSFGTLRITHKYRLHRDTAVVWWVYSCKNKKNNIQCTAVFVSRNNPFV